MPGKRDLFAEARQFAGTPGRPSKLERLLDSLDGDERAEVIEFVWNDGDDPQVTHRTIAAVLTDHYGAEFGEFSLQLIQRSRARPKPT